MTQRALPEAVDVHFVKAGTNSITLDLAVHGNTDSTKCFELQWMKDDDPDGIWVTASKILKTRRCTKGSLTPGTAYRFRSRASAGGERWGPFGKESQTLFTKLPEVHFDMKPSHLVCTHPILA